MAKLLSEAAGADLYEIKPAVPYTRADLNWNNSHSRSSLEMNDPASRPELAGAMPDVSAYEQIYLGFPIWWYVEPRIVDTFLDTPFSGDERHVRRIAKIAQIENEQ